MGYGGIAFLILVFLLIRVGILYGRRVPLIFIGLLVIGRFTLPEMLGPYRFEIYVACLAIILVLIDRFKSVRWHSM
jgi:hypothetical protein